MDDDTFAIRTSAGEPLPLRPSQLPVLTPADELHVLDGDEHEGYGGGHAPGAGRPSKTEFPARWGRHVRPRVEEAMRRPVKVVRSPEGDDLSFYGLVDDVLVLVRLRRDDGKWTFVTAFPINGRGVVYNSPRGPVERPLDVSKLRR